MRRLALGTRSERGFSLIELLVVILIIGILAAIALPLFLGKRNNAQDADAKSNARNLATEVESCFTPNQDFTQCQTLTDLDGGDGLDWGSGPGQVEVISATKSSYVITAVSKGTTNGSNHTFTITRAIGGDSTFTCTTGTSDNTGGGCKGGTW
jgi:type IV pilus assembly protein PilA